MGSCARSISAEEIYITRDEEYVTGVKWFKHHVEKLKDESCYQVF